MWREGLDPGYEFLGEVCGEARVYSRRRTGEVFCYPADDGAEMDPMNENLRSYACPMIYKGIWEIVERGFRYITIRLVDDRWSSLADRSESFPREGCPPDAPANEMRAVVCRLVVLRGGGTGAEGRLVVYSELLAMSDHAAGPPPGRMTVENSRWARAPPVEQRDSLQRAHDVWLGVIVEEISRALVVGCWAIMGKYRRLNVAPDNGERIDE
ncbi:unnamed protein product [Aspergillus oryzae]|nr:unnamed protein product [Aspergillus oryzae]